MIPFPTRPAFSALAKAILVAVVLGPALPAGPARAEPRCYGDWSDASPVVAREGLRSAREIQGTARHRFGGDIVRITLCREAGAFIYRVVVRSDDGRISQTTVSAAPAH